MKKTLTNVNKLNYFALQALIITCLILPAAAFSQGVGFFIDLGRRQGQTLTESRTFSAADLNDEARNRILAANRRNDSQAVAAQNDLIVSAVGRGNPFINFEDGKTLASVSGNLTNASPVALASADFDADGTEDLAVVYASENGAIVSVRRGNVESIFPPGADAKPSPFFAETREFEILLVPDFFAAGDFTGDGRADLLIAKRGFDSLVLLGGNGDGNFNAPQIVRLKGEVTAFATGEVNNFDNLPDVAVGIVEKGKPQVLIFQSRNGAFGAEAEVLKISKTANALGIGNLNDDSFGDLIAATDSELIFSAGRNLVAAKRGEIKAERILRQRVDFAASDLAIGDFSGDASTDFAMLSKNGEVFIGNFTGEGAKRNLRISSTSLSVSNAPTNAKIIAAKVSTRQKTDLIVAGNQNLQILSSDGENFFQAAMFDANSETIAVLPMRLNKDALRDLVVLTKNNLEPSVLMTAPMSVITVNSASGNGGGGGTSLTNAILTANNSPGLDEIQFNLPTGSRLISMVVGLPAITDPITINGLSQSNPNGEPFVSLTIHPNFPTDEPTLSIAAGNSVVRGLILNGTGVSNPVFLNTNGNNFVESNYIGTDNSGTASSLQTTASGVVINNSSGNTIGGAVTQARNVISGIQDLQNLMPFDGVFGKPSGVRINGGGSTNNLVLGNYIGLHKNGMQAIPNAGAGVLITTTAGGNRIGGATEGERNVISGNTIAGVAFASPIYPFSPSGNLVENNYIGTKADGNSALGNGEVGIYLEYNTNNSSTAVDMIYDNVVSGNNGDGVYVVNNGTISVSNIAPEGGADFLIDLARQRTEHLNGTTIPTGNRIGTNVAGNAALPNTGNGVRLENAPAKIEGNLISANGQSGIFITGETPFGNLIADNFIGTNADGTNALGNTGNGIKAEMYFEDANAETQTLQIYDNVISGNGSDGVFASLTSSTGSNVAPEGGVKFLIDLARRPGGNLNNGTNPLFQGNRIGTNTAGNAALPNGGNGVRLQNVVAKIESNLISGNGANGVEISQLSYQLGQLNANLIGTNAGGTAAIANGGDGVNLVITLAESITAYKMTDNLISGNANDGIRAFTNAGNSGNQLAGTGITVDISGSRSGNVASFGATSDGNYIGVSRDGTVAIPNGGNGINLMETEAIIEGNLISGNTAKGVTVQNSLLGQLNANRIGTNAAGNAAVPNGTGGVELEMQISQTDDAYKVTDNLISGNTGDGIKIFPSSSGASQIVGGGITVDISGSRTGNLTPTSGGNFIGTKADGVSALPNTGNGISVTNVPTKIGGTMVDDGNIIAFNGANGIVIFGGTGNLIMNNPIFANALLPIDLNGDGATPNDALDADTGANNLQNYPVLASALSNETNTYIFGTINTTPNTNLTIQFYAASVGSTNGGKPLGNIAVQTDASGSASFNANLPVGLAVGTFVSATATTDETNNGNENNTSEFSAGVAVLAPTTANVTVTGKVLASDGRSIPRAIVTLTAADGTIRTATANSFGNYRFENVAVGGTYVFGVRAKGYIFNPQIINVNEAINLDLRAEP